MTVWLLFFNMLTHSPGLCETIANDRLTGEDLAKALPSFANKIPGDAVIGFSPTPGARRIFKSLESCSALALPMESRSRRTPKRVSSGACSN